MNQYNNIYQFVNKNGSLRWDDTPVASVDNITDAISYNIKTSVVGAILLINKITDIILASTYIHNNIKGKKICFDAGEDYIEALFMKPLIYRRCCVYPVIQYSKETDKIRITVWGSDYVSHSGQSFGTSLENVTEDTITEHIKKIISEYHLFNDYVTKRLHNGQYILFV